MTRQQYEFINYLTQRYDCISKLPAIRIGCKDFGLTILEAKKAYESIEQFQ